MAQGQALLTPEQAGELLGVAPKTLASWRLTGAGPRFVKLGTGGKTSPVRYRADAVERYIADRERGSTSEAAA